ncbi:MAG: hypothetical protein NTW26_08515 [bacterium]|nr:hypothetical protein [bacterium]
MRIVVTIMLLVMALGATAEVYEFYWDDGVCGGGWVWYTGGNYWAVQFDEEKTTGQPGTVTSVGAYVFPGWPDGTYQGVNMHVFSDSGGLPGDDLGYEFISGPGWQWASIDVDVDSGVFWIAWQDIGSYPSCDALGFDADGTGHSWGGGDWINWGDAMLRCYWEGELTQVVESTWGLIKTLW